jgi:hypothetical protein
MASAADLKFLIWVLQRSRREFQIERGTRFNGLLGPGFRNS